jgi:hypothetical protein
LVQNGRLAFDYAEAYQQCAVTEILMHEKQTPIRIHLHLLAFYGECTADIISLDLWVRKSKDSAGILALNDQL